MNNKTNSAQDKFQVSDVIQYLNEQTGKRFREESKGTIKLINRLQVKGYELEDFKKVIDYMVRQWSHIDSMRPYLKPSTLFEVCNFKRYMKKAKDND